MGLLQFVQKHCVPSSDPLRLQEVADVLERERLLADEEILAAINTNRRVQGIGPFKNNWADEMAALGNSLAEKLSILIRLGGAEAGLVRIEREMEGVRREVLTMGFRSTTPKWVGKISSETTKKAPR